jgi:hypothetical protein
MAEEKKIIYPGLDGFYEAM